MRLPDATDLSVGLRRWLEHHGWMVKTVVEKSRTASATPFDKNLFYRWQDGTRIPSYERLVNDIFPALEITSVARMLVFFGSFCQAKPDINSITVIKGKDHSRDKRLGFSIIFADESRVGPHPVRIDRAALTAKEPSVITAHHGFNYLLVLKGEVICSFWNVSELTKIKSSSPDRKVTLKPGDAVAFQTSLPHKVESVSGSANVVIARPPWARPDPLT